MYQSCMCLESEVWVIRAARVDMEAGAFGRVRASACSTWECLVRRSSTGFSLRFFVLIICLTVLSLSWVLYVVFNRDSPNTGVERVNTYYIWLLLVVCRVALVKESSTKTAQLSRDVFLRH